MWSVPSNSKSSENENESPSMAIDRMRGLSPLGINLNAYVPAAMPKALSYVPPTYRSGSARRAWNTKSALPVPVVSEATVLITNRAAIAAIATIPAYAAFFTPRPRRGAKLSLSCTARPRTRRRAERAAGRAPPGAPRSLVVEQRRASHYDRRHVRLGQ